MISNHLISACHGQYTPFKPPCSREGVMYATDTPRRFYRQTCCYRMPAAKSHYEFGYARLTGGFSFVETSLLSKQRKRTRHGRGLALSPLDPALHVRDPLQVCHESPRLNLTTGSFATENVYVSKVGIALFNTHKVPWTKTLGARRQRKVGSLQAETTTATTTADTLPHLPARRASQRSADGFSSHAACVQEGAHLSFRRIADSSLLGG